MMSIVHVTWHAIERYRERVRDVSVPAARAALSGPTFIKAIEIGAPFVKLADGQHAVIVDGRVITVLPKDAWLGTFALSPIPNS